VKDAIFLSALYERATQLAKATPRGDEPVSRISFSHEDLLRVFIAAGLSRKKNLTAVSVQEWKDNKEDYDADILDFTFIFEVLLRQRILVETSAPAPIESGTLDRMTSSKRNLGVSMPIPMGVLVSYAFTEVGTAFVRACQPPTAP
jgi:hypothetical protein